MVLNVDHDRTDVYSCYNNMFSYQERYIFLKPGIVAINLIDIHCF